MEAFEPENLWKAWEEERFVNTAAPCLRHEHLQKYLKALAAHHAGELRLEEVGSSFLGRPIQMLTMGRGPENILLWSQMHGDEPSATPALLDIAHYVLEHAEEPAVRSVLDCYTLLMIPMLNPDGAEVYQRRNAQGIDINRDALQLATPEGILLKRIRDEYEPILGFNLHDQDRRISVGDTGHVANMAVLSVSGDMHNTLTLGRLRTKRANAAIATALAPFIPGGISRYHEDWSPTAFGDNITAWGTPVILIESGGVPAGTDVTELTRLNFVAILSVLGSLALDDLAAHDPRVYDDLPLNREQAWSDVVVRGGYVMQPGSSTAFRADLAFDRLLCDRQVAGCGVGVFTPSQIVMVGDASTHGAGTSVNARECLLIAPFTVGVRGLKEKHWLNHANLTRMAHMGTGTLCWAVDDTDRNAALDHTAQLKVPGLPQVKVMTGPGKFPGVVMNGPPDLAGKPASVGNILESLGAHDSDCAVALEKMWVEAPGDCRETPPLIRHRPASFLMVSPAPEGKIDFATSRLVSVWLDGQRIAPA